MAFVFSLNNKLRAGLFCLLVSFCWSASSQEILLALEGGSSPEMNAYDPFTDYSDFETPEDEAKDIRFFKRGRFLTVGLFGGMRFFTGALRNHLDIETPNFGFFLSYFVNLTTALQFSSLFSSHKFFLRHESLPAPHHALEGHMDFFTFGLDLKYYFDKERLIPFIAFFNPYVIVGFSLTLRPALLYERDAAAADPNTKGYGIRSGFGIEINIAKRFYIGLLGDFNYTTFPDEFDSILDTGIKLHGDMAHALFIAGVNF